MYVAEETADRFTATHQYSYTVVIMVRMRGGGRKKRKRTCKSEEEEQQECVVVDDSMPPPSSSNYHRQIQQPSNNNNNNKKEDGDSPRQGQGDDLSNLGGGGGGGGKASIIIMPEKHMLQLVIDILQRRDTYEIFAEPVDPNEVEDYYQIVKDPMDFGTMRAKLHEGMYKDLDQFKHDVFLITRNAMHFNSSATIYFRQARAIHELAKRVFHLLKTEPENFELEFSGTRRRSTRRSPNEAKDYRVTAHVKSSNVTSVVSPKGKSRSVGNSIVRITGRGNPWTAGMPIQTKINYCDLLSAGSRRDGKSNHVEADPRSTYRHNSYTFGCDNNNLVRSRCFCSNPLIPTNGQDTNYRKSLLLFVKDLGTTAQMIATQKIGGSSWTPNSTSTGSGFGFQSPAACGSSPRESPHLDSLSITESHNITGSLHGWCSVLERNDIRNGGGEKSLSRKKRMTSTGGGASPGEDTVSYNNEEMKITSAAGTKNGKAKITELLLSPCSRDASAKSTRVAAIDAASAGGKLDENVRPVPVVLALEHSYANINASNEWKWRNKKSCRVSIPESKASSSQANSGPTDSFDSVLLQRDATGSSCSLATPTHRSLESRSKSKNWKINLLEEEEDEEEEERVVSVSPFAFDLGFLKAQLDEMNVRVQLSSRSNPGGPSKEMDPKTENEKSSSVELQGSKSCPMVNTNYSGSSRRRPIFSVESKEGSFRDNIPGRPPNNKIKSARGRSSYNKSWPRPDAAVDADLALKLS